MRYKSMGYMYQLKMLATGINVAICGMDKRIKSPGSYPGNRQFKSGSPQLVGLTTITYGDVCKGVTLYTTPPLCG